VTAKEWFSAQELAAAGLPGLPTTKQGVHHLAKREGWPSRARVGRGGGREYHASSLPRPAQSALLLGAGLVSELLQAGQVKAALRVAEAMEAFGQTLIEQAHQIRDNIGARA